MNEDDLQRFTANFVWFNEFFGDISQLLHQVAHKMEAEFGLKQLNYYYPKQNEAPTLPQYYALGCGGDIAVQILAVFDASMIDPHHLTAGDDHRFQTEPSLIVVKHAGEEEKYHYYQEWGLKVIRNEALRDLVWTGDSLKGLIGRVGVPFYAFQVSLDHFKESQDLDLNRQIEETIIKPLKSLPPWS